MNKDAPPVETLRVQGIGLSRMEPKIRPVNQFRASKAHFHCPVWSNLLFKEGGIGKAGIQSSLSDDFLDSLIRVEIEVFRRGQLTFGAF